MRCITSKENSLLKEIRKLCTSKKFRMEQGLYVCEGEKLFEEAVRSDKFIQYAVCEQSCYERLLQKRDSALQIAITKGCSVILVDQACYASISTLEHYQGILFVCVMTTQHIKLQTGKRYLALDGVQDPGNVGTILRAADAFGVAVYLLDGCVDIYNPKTVRAAMGSLFRVPIESITKEEFLITMQEQGICVYAAALCEDSIPIGNVDLENAVVVIGNEGRGVSQQILQAADRHIILPMRGITESLNAAVAASIIMWEMSKE